MTIVELITIILFFFFFGYGLVRFFMDLTEYVAWRWQKMSEKSIVISGTLLRLLVCIAVSQRGLTDEEWQFMTRLEKELFDDE